MENILWYCRIDFIRLTMKMVRVTVHSTLQDLHFHVYLRQDNNIWDVKDVLRYLEQ